MTVTEEKTMKYKINNPRYSKLVMPLFVLMLVLCLIMRLFGMKHNVLAVIYVTLSSSLLLLYILNSNYDKNKKLIFILAFIARIVGTCIDLYFFRLPHAASDDDGFYKSSLRYFDGSVSISEEIYGGVYVQFLYFLYFFVGPNRLGGQFTNVLFSMISIIYFAKMLDKLSINNKVKNLGIILIAFMPNFIFLNCILRRDTLITFLTILSMDKFLDWYQSENLKCAVIACLYVVVAASIHSAMIFVFFMYLLIIFMYSKKKDKIDFSGLNFAKSIFTVCFIGVIGWYLLENVHSKFSGFTNVDTLYDSVSRSYGGSAYLTNMQIESVPQLIMFSPFKFVYFLFSPMPWDVRNIMDVFTFVFDGMINLYLFYVVVRNKKREFGKIMFLVFVPVALVFGLGTFTSGAAARHRYNVFPFLLVSACCVLDEKEKEKSHI